MTRDSIDKCIELLHPCEHLDEHEYVSQDDDVLAEIFQPLAVDQKACDDLKDEE